ncbi:MAG: LptF/LptG family permease [Deltaproteobacteria bacterium]|nr:LptF/LptG family permease [Deltaproteobacteria bacterium]
MYNTLNIVLSLYVIKRILLSFLFALLTSSLLLSFISFVQYADIFVVKGIRIADLFQILVFMLPMSIEFALPLSLMVSLIYVFYILITKNEILTIELTGNTRYTIAVPVILLSVLVFIVNFLSSSFLFPYSIKIIKDKATTFVGHSLRNSLSERRINDEIPDTVIFFESKNNNMVYENVLIFQKEENGENLLTYSKDAVIAFHKGSQTIDVEMRDGSIIQKDNMSLRYIKFKSGSMKIDISEIIEKRIKNIRGFYQTGSYKDKLICTYDVTYLSLVNLWIGILAVIIFLKNLNLSLFWKNCIFLFFVVIYYFGFRLYHFLFEMGIMKVAHSFLFVCFFLFLTLFLINRFLPQE